MATVGRGHKAFSGPDEHPMSSKYIKELIPTNAEFSQ
jgi:hypothetical protein